MKKVSIISLHLGYGGVEQAVTSLANMLSTRYKVEIISIYKLYENPCFEVNENIKITYLIKSDLPLKLAKYKELIKKFELIKIIKLLKKDYIVNNQIIKMFKDFYFGTKMMTKDRKTILEEYLKKSNSDIIISTKEMYNKLLGNLDNENIIKIGWEHNHHNNNNKYINKIVNSSKKLDYLILVSNELAEFYKEKLKNKKCQVYHISNVLDYLPSQKSTLEQKKLISIGRLSKEKGYLDLLKIIKKIDNKEWHLDIVGDGNDYVKLDNYIKENELENQVELHGFKSKKEINKLLNSSSIYLMTSLSESFGIVLIEAMSHGIPCIAYSSAKGATEIITNDKNGYLIQNRNEEEYIEKLIYLMNNKEKRQELGIEGFNSIKKYTKEKISKEWFKLIEGEK